MINLDFIQAYLRKLHSPVNSKPSSISPWLASLSYFLGRHIVMPLYFRKINIIGKENIPKDGPVILAPTHRSRWDGLIIPYTTGRLVTGRDLRFMVSMDEMKCLQGWLIRHLGGFPLNPKNPAVSCFRYGVELMLKREMLVIFPEGKIYRDNQVHSLKTGLARIGLQAESYQQNLGVKIVPISLNYNPVIPRRACNVMVRIGVPLSVNDYIYGSGKKQAQNLTMDLEAALKNIDGHSTINN
ncbi:MAG: 1-acyl-sn-glycerol-3-phosphate acyltransferase [Okeania sp. SIO2G4]|uniref:lysophospholipid acyltransferase family protein n=1 Tax=unclassified Okeania TaxID=2634635 RepID=UPI0013B65059|nr:MULTISPECIES: 1-acyl-sn-glycerol-3-phosphate acyltransferase [unclassified Okeania]NEP06891.1 1-acyl-sn-glycerol-3-phosphate acyltransferase [Okeania sp. SIO4D6]NEP38586.1 1-acyl-sn-glycerol-3-phosphate acyltransferase [Okeania sp. SIO2H7]NEP72812.1 1-acyl-sn-glycerol-3-phosphate acyltransferase [Okeania sp. SIO2G5]NEP93599.1 1-acyl-sn-glycerol-3-phosphate acyltransferase [Okeania sp. SIO2F5]NEQ91503.1 1-acyl-sn-glycerol-3-phosphate acyltransferase [Okeania sp. SIO2G4]